MKNQSIIGAQLKIDMVRVFCLILLQLEKSFPYFPRKVKSEKRRNSHTAASK